MSAIGDIISALLSPNLLSPLPNGPLPPMAAPKKIDPFEGFTQNIPNEYKDLISNMANQAGVDPRILAAVLFQESKFNPKAIHEGVTESGQAYSDRGIAQINNTAFPNITNEQAMDPNFAIKFASELLAKNKKGFSGDINKALASYNVGYGGVANNLGQNTPFGGGEKGQTYIDNVARNLSPEVRKALGLKTRYE